MTEHDVRLIEQGQREGRATLLEELRKELAMTLLLNVEGASKEWLNGLEFALERIEARA